MQRRLVRAVRQPSLTSIPLGVPDTKWVRLKYVQETSIDTGLASINKIYFRANSLFDPDFTGVGHQPLHYDELNVPYDHYTVYGSKITVTVINVTGSAQVPGTMGIFLDDDTTLTYTTGDQVIESNQRQSIWRCLGGIEGWRTARTRLNLTS